MSGKRRLQHSDSNENQPRASPDDVLTGSEPAKAATAATSSSAQAAGAKKRPSKKRKIAALVTPAVISGVAGAVPQAVINAAQEAVHAVAGQQFYSPSAKPSASGGEYMLSAEWQGGYPSAANRTAAVQMAKNVVDIALRKAPWRDCDPGHRYRYIQWVLAGNMSPAEAAQVLAQRMFRTRIRPFKELVQLIRQDSPAISPPVVRPYVYQSHLYRPPYRKL